MGANAARFFFDFQTFWNFFKPISRGQYQSEWKKNLPHRVQFVMDYKKMPFRSTNFITLHGLLYILSNFSQLMTIRQKCTKYLWTEGNDLVTVKYEPFLFYSYFSQQGKTFFDFAYFYKTFKLSNWFNENWSNNVSW